MSDIKCISDHIGRTVVGTVVSETKTELVLNNPVIFHVVPNPESGELQVQSFPYLFMELIAGDKKKNEWAFIKSNIVQSTVELDARVIAQYKNVNLPRTESAESLSASDSDVIQLFGDDD